MIEIKNLDGNVLFAVDRPDLSRAGLSWANLSGANLSGADLSEANLSEADLFWANLSGADLSEANLSEADLFWANLSKTDLSRAGLSWANLSKANLSRANLFGANLSGANMSWANLSRANLSEANLFDARLPHYKLCPDGAFTAWKKVDGHVIELLIPAEAERVGGLTGRKCRAEFARVVNITPEASDGVTTRRVTYRVGEMVYPDNWDNNIRVECTHGIHFFITREEADEW